MLNDICCICAGAHHPWDCARARRFVSEVTDGTITPHDATQFRRERERAQMLDEAAVVLRAAVCELDRDDRELIRRAYAEGQARRRAGVAPRGRVTRRAAVID